MDNKEFGIRRIQKLITEAELPLVRYKWDSFVTAIFPLEEEKPSVIPSGKTTQEVTQQITQDTTQEKIFSLLKHKPEITRNKIAESIGISPDGVKYHLNELKRSGRIRHVGPTKKGQWEVIEQSIFPPTENKKTSVKTSVKTSGETTQEVTQQITQDTTQEKIFSLLKHKPEITRNEIAESIGISPDGVKYHLNELRCSGRIRHAGATKKGYWEIMEEKDIE